MRRTRTLRSTASALLLVALFAAGCGNQDDSPTATDPASSESPAATDETPDDQPDESPTDPSDDVPEGQVPYSLVTIISVSNAGGEVSGEPTYVRTPRQARDFGAGFDTAQIGRGLVRAVRSHGPPRTGRQLATATIDISCDPPTDVAVRQVGDGIEVTAVKAKADKQCLVPITSVALLELPA